MINPIYHARHFHLQGLKGISDQTLDMHFQLYEAYVKETNELKRQIADLRAKGINQDETQSAYVELKRRLSFQYNGVVLHGYYFENLQKNGSGEPEYHSKFHKATVDSFGSYEIWKADFVRIGKTRSVGWAICYKNITDQTLSNQWISLNDPGNVSGFHPVLVMDVWEHAYLLDYEPDDRPAYIEAFFSNIDWRAVEQRVLLNSA